MGGRMGTNVREVPGPAGCDEQEPTCPDPNSSGKKLVLPASPEVTGMMPTGLHIVPTRSPTTHTPDHQDFTAPAHSVQAILP